MSGDRNKSKKEQEVRFRIVGLETPNGRMRVQKAHEKLFAALHESHHALIGLVNFLDSPPFKELIKTISDEFKEPTLRQKKWIHTIMEQYMRVLEEAKNVREETSNTSEEFNRAMDNMPPRQQDEPRKLHE
jgi:hypothetical protein